MFDPVEITRLHQFGSSLPSSNYDEHVRPKNSPAPEITYSMSEFMTSGAGRFAYPSLFPAIQKFFEDTTLADGVHSLDVVVAALGLTDADRNINISNYSTGLLTSDHALRAYMFGNSKFLLNFEDSVSFTVDGDNRLT